MNAAEHGPAAEALAALITQLGDDHAAATLGSHALHRLAILSRLQTALDVEVRQTVQDAAALGASYAQLGAAWNITRQGARQRWAGLVYARSPLPQHSIEGHSDMPRDASRPYNVLLVEDDDADAMLIEEAMVDRGLTRAMHRAHDGISALDYLRNSANERPNLIVLDLNMPRMNGLELLTVLKNDQELASIPVVVLTTSAAPDDVIGAYQGHANAYVTKPVNLDDFIGAVQSIDAFFLDIATTPTIPDATR